jgi:hypothetical protein
MEPRRDFETQTRGMFTDRRASRILGFWQEAGHAMGIWHLARPLAGNRGQLAVRSTARRERALRSRSTSGKS